MWQKIKRVLVEGKLTEQIYQKIKTVIKSVFKSIFDGSYRERLFRKIDTYIGNAARTKLAEKTEIESNKILFVTTRGTYNCNPRAIANEIIRQKLPWKLVWAARTDCDLEQFPEELEVVYRGSYEFYKAAASAKVWIDNSINMSYLMPYKKTNQVLFETWHGSIGLKRFENNSDKVWLNHAKSCGARTDYIISDSDFEDGLFRNSFWRETPILKYGHARNDILLNDNAQIKEAMKKEILKRVGERMEVEEADCLKFALYAPTFRDDRKLDYYKLNYDEVRKALETKFGGTWIILVRQHFEIKRKMKKKKIDYGSLSA